MTNQTNKSTNQLRIEGAKAYLKSLQEGPDAGLAELHGKDDPVSILRQLQIYISADRIHDAADLVRDRVVDTLWGDKAVFVLAANGEIEVAKLICTTTKQRKMAKKWSVACAQGRLYRLIMSKEGRQPRLTPEEKSECDDILLCLSSIVKDVELCNSIESEIEFKALELALLATGMLGYRSQSETLAALLASWIPVSHELAHATINGWIMAPDNLPERLRNDYNGSYDMSLAACAVEEHLGDRNEKAFESALMLVERADTKERRERLYSLLVSLAQKLGDVAQDKVMEIAPLLLRHNIRLLSLHKALDLVRHGKYGEADQILMAYKDEDDPAWLQVQASRLLSKGDTITASAHLAKASRILVDPELLWDAAKVAHQAGQINDMVEALRCLAEIDSTAKAPLYDLAVIYFQREQYADAAIHFGKLLELVPEDDDVGVNYATSLVLCGKHEEADGVYKGLCSKSEPSLKAVLGYAKLLHTQGRDVQSLDLLNQHWNNGNNDEEYLNVFINTAYAAGADAFGGEALSQLIRLHSEGKTKNLQECSVNEVIDMMYHHRNQEELVHTKVSEGRIPWLYAERVMNRPSYMGWSARTQPLKWETDDIIDRARYSIYSTNGFSVRTKDGQQPWLEPVACPPQGTVVVADLSALITLHQLHLLVKAADYFGIIMFPSLYFVNELDEANQLASNHTSLKQFYENVDKAMNDGSLHVLDEIDKSNDSRMPCVNEYSDDEDETEHYYRLADIACMLHKTGKIGEEQYQSALSDNMKRSGADDDHMPLTTAQPVCISLSSLRTIYSWNLLDTVLQALTVHISARERIEVSTSLGSIQHQEQMRITHQDLWDTIRKDKRFVGVSVSIDNATDHIEGKHYLGDIPLLSYYLSKNEHASLLVDDRASQSIALNDRKDSPYIAFGTDQLIMGILEADIINAEQAADYFMQLIQWRYRFIIPPVSVLKTLADLFRNNPPGKPLRDCARYMHSCMRDPGLLTGLVETHPPMSMAVKLYSAWLQAISELIIDIWNDDEYSDEHATRFTVWAMTEFLPSVPLALEPHQQVNLAAATVESSIILYTMPKLPRISNAERGHKAIVAIATGLGIQDKSDRYVSIVTEVIERASINK